MHDCDTATQREFKKEPGCLGVDSLPDSQHVISLLFRFAKTSRSDLLLKRLGRESKLFTIMKPFIKVYDKTKLVRSARVEMSEKAKKR